FVARQIGLDLRRSFWERQPQHALRLERGDDFLDRLLQLRFVLHEELNPIELAVQFRRGIDADVVVGRSVDDGRSFASGQLQFVGHSQSVRAINCAAMSSLRIIPLGGLGEIGMNLMIYETDDAAIIVDCGMMFPDAATLGVDVIVPDMTYIFDNAAKFKAVFLTHGHEDHIGALPFLLERVPLPVYGMPLTLGFVRDKLDEFGVDHIELRGLMPRDVVDAGPFRVEAIRVTHSIVDAVGFAITTPHGVVIHTGDFKIDHTPIDAKPTDIARFAHCGEQSVLLLVSDSTNALVAGHCPSERTVGNALEHVFNSARSRIIVTTFASHIHRVQQVIDAARKSKRKVMMMGRSLVDTVETAERLAYIRFAREVRASGTEEPHELVIMTTGTQGEPTSALSRMAVGEHKQVTIEQGDVVVISARTIPGNERAVAHVIDNLYRRGAEVVTHETPDV